MHNNNSLEMLERLLNDARHVIASMGEVEVKNLTMVEVGMLNQRRLAIFKALDKFGFVLDKMTNQVEPYRQYLVK